jgi:hypothetical protein
MSEEKLRLTENQKLVLHRAYGIGLKRVSGGWITKHGEFIKSTTAESLRKKNLVDVNDRRRLVTTQQGFIALNRSSVHGGTQ